MRKRISDLDHIACAGPRYHWAQTNRGTQMFYLTLLVAALAPFGFALGQAIGHRHRRIAPMRRSRG